MTVCNIGIFAGMDTAVLQQWLGEAQQAMHDLSTGAKGQNYSYTQGDGAKSVTYTQANIASLAAWIAQLQQALGMTVRSRRPISFTFR